MITTALALQPPSTASAGTYNVTACGNDTVNRSWGIYRSNGFADAMVDCTPRGTPPIVDVGMVARNTGGPGTAPYYSHAGLSFYAPPGARIVRVSGEVRANSSGGWAAGLFDETSGQGSLCCGNFITWRRPALPGGAIDWRPRGRPPVASPSACSARRPSVPAMPSTVTRRCAT